MNPLTAALKIDRFSDQLEDIAQDDGRELESYTVEELTIEAHHLMHLFDTPSCDTHMEAYEYTNAQGETGDPDLRKQHKALARWLKRYASKGIPNAS